MSRAELLALAERVEALSGADREVDAKVALAVGYKTWPDGYGEGNEWEDPSGNRLPRARGWGAQPPAFTASLDAAMGLVPEGPGWWWVVNGAPSAAVGHAPEPAHFAHAATPALALTAAALRARAEGVA